MNTKSKRRYKSILAMGPLEARKFLLKQESYCNFSLPTYFVFAPMLERIDHFLTGQDISRLQRSKPRDHENLGHVILNNKYGKYAWRPLQLIHPVLYVSLVHTITSTHNWRSIRKRFSEFSSSQKIQCLSIPVVSLTNDKDRGQQIFIWWKEIEQKSIELALEYEYFFQTDISDCYGSLYTHSISWALHSRTVAKYRRNDRRLLGNCIDKAVSDMSNGQTNGIPQGSVLMDFIAEIVLGYADTILSKKLQQLVNQDYRIIRFRDDYRVFVNNPKDGEKILKAISEIMFEIGMKLNPVKTMASNRVVSDSIKQDKLSWIGKKQSTKNIQKHLLIIHSHAMNYPNSGTLTVALQKFNKKIEKNKTLDSNSKLMPVISIAVDIAFKQSKSLSRNRRNSKQTCGFIE